MKDEKKKEAQKWLEENISSLWMFIFKINFFLYAVMLLWIAAFHVPQLKNLIYPHYGYSFALIIIGYLSLLKLIFTIYKWIFWRKFEFWLYLLGYTSVSINHIQMYQSNSYGAMEYSITSAFIIICLMFIKKPIVFK